jgi:hypothetical protein
MTLIDKIRRGLNTGDSCDLLSAMSALAELETELVKLRAFKAAIDAAPTVAWLSVDCIGERYLCFSLPVDNSPVTELIARPEAK